MTIYVFAIVSIILAVLCDNNCFIGLTVMALNNNKNFKKGNYGVSKISLRRVLPKGVNPLTLQK